MIHFYCVNDKKVKKVKSLGQELGKEYPIEKPCEIRFHIRNHDV